MFGDVFGQTDSLSVSGSIEWVKELVETAWTTFKPGGTLHPQAFIEHKGHLVMEGLLLVVITYLLLFNGQRKPKGRKEERPLTEEVERGNVVVGMFVADRWMLSLVSVALE